MPRKYVRKTQKATWTLQQLLNAVKEAETGKSIRNTAIRFNIPYSTLRERIADKNVGDPRLGSKPVFSVQQENEISDRLCKMARMFYGLTKDELRRNIYIYAEKNNISHRFNEDKKMAGRDWLEGFLKRNPRIGVRKPEATSINRIKAFNKEEVSLFYNNLQEVMTKYNFEADRIYNVDETGISVVHEPKKILADKSMKRVGGATSGERGKNHTLCCAVSAAGHYVPPMYIFPRVRMTPNLMIGGIPGSIYRATKTGYMNEKLFLEWLVHFKEKVNASIDNPVLLIMDNHSSHCTLEAYEYCTLNGIIIVSLPPHTSHRLQPLDLTIFGPFHKQFDDECDQEMKKTPYSRITSAQLPSLSKEAWNKTCNTDKAINGFSSSGIYPLNPNIFSNDEFYVDDEESIESNSGLHYENRGIETVNNETMELIESDSGLHVHTVGVDTVNDEILQCTLDTEVSELTEEELTQNGFVIVEPMLWDVDENILPASTVHVEFSSLVPLPKSTKVFSTKIQKKQHSVIMTSPDYKVVLEGKKARRDLKDAKLLLPKKPKGEKKKDQRKLVDSIDQTAPKKRGRPKKQRETVVNEYQIVEAKDVNEDVLTTEVIDEKIQGKPKQQQETDLLIEVVDNIEPKKAARQRKQKTAKLITDKVDEITVRKKVGRAKSLTSATTKIRKAKNDLKERNYGLCDSCGKFGEFDDLCKCKAYLVKTSDSSWKIGFNETEPSEPSNPYKLCVTCGNFGSFEEFFQCKACMVCLHIGCSSDETIINDLCTECLDI